MSRYGDEMIQDLAKLLNVDELTKTAEKKEDKKEDKKDEKKCKECDKEPCECKKEENKEDKKEEKEPKKDEKKEKKEPKKDDKKKKKAEVMFGIVTDLVKLANDLDDQGATEASDIIDDALKAIMNTLDK